MTAAEGSIFITGANGGLGSAIVKQIASSSKYAQKYHGIYTVRDVSRADAVKKALHNNTTQKKTKTTTTTSASSSTGTGHTYDLLSLDLSSLASTRKVADDINARVAAGSLPPIRALILNAAWQEWTTHTMTDDGFDMTFQANYLSHFLLALLLLRSMDRENGRIVILGSWSHDTTDKRNFVPGVIKPYVEDRYKVIFREPVEIEPLARGKWSVPTADDPDQSGDNGYRRYGAAKLCEIMFMRELANRISSDPQLSRVCVVGVDPGAMPTGLTRRQISNPLLQGAVQKIAPLIVGAVALFTKSSDYRTTCQSANDVLYAAFDFENAKDSSSGSGGGDKANGKYLNGHVLSETGPEARDEKKCRILWTESVRFAGLRHGDTVLTAWQ